MSQFWIAVRAVCILPVLLLLAPAAQSKKAYYPAGTSMIKVQGKVARHFDRDKDGYLNMVEAAFCRTHLRFGYPLVKKRKQRAYDTNQNAMLEPDEWRAFSLAKETGTLKKPNKDKEEVVAGAGGMRYLSAKERVRLIKMARKSLN